VPFNTLVHDLFRIPSGRVIHETSERFARILPRRAVPARRLPGTMARMRQSLDTKETVIGDLPDLLRSLSPRRREGVFVFVHVASGEPLPDLAPLMTFQEAEGITMIVDQEQGDAHGLKGSFPSTMITLDVRSALHAVGLLAAVTSRLAAAGIAVNAVSAFHHDHLFVPLDRAGEALRLLQELQG
jgi:hypothetical protein